MAKIEQSDFKEFKEQMQQSSIARMFREQLLDTFYENSILARMKRERQKREFVGKLKHGKKYRYTDDPGPL